MVMSIRQRLLARSQEGCASLLVCLLQCLLSLFIYRVYQKNVPSGKLLASTSDIPHNLGYFLQPRVIRCLLVYLGHKIIFPSNFLLPGGCFLSSNFEMACAQNCQPENGMLFNWLQV